MIVTTGNDTAGGVFATTVKYRKEVNEFTDLENVRVRLEPTTSIMMIPTLLLVLVIRLHM